LLNHSGIIKPQEKHHANSGTHQRFHDQGSIRTASTGEASGDTAGGFLSDSERSSHRTPNSVGKGKALRNRLFVGARNRERLGFLLPSDSWVESQERGNARFLS